MTHRTPNRTHILVALLAAGCSTTTAPEKRLNYANSPASIRALSQDFATAESSLKIALASKRDTEAKLAQTYEALLLLCKAKFDDLENDHQRYANAEARTNVLGSLVALLGSVATYAPGKTVLMGIGLSSSNEGTVSSGITQFFSNRSATDKATLIDLKRQLANAFDRYDNTDQRNDPEGYKRSTILARAKGICLGLSPSASAPPPDSSASSAPS